MNYDLGILSGDPTKQAQTLAPEISAQQQQIHQAAKTGAEFGTRSGGTTASTASAEATGRGNIINLLGGEQAGAAASAGNLGGSNLGMASGNINDVAGLKTAQQQREQADVGGIVSGAAGIAGDMIGMGADTPLTPPIDAGSPTYTSPSAAPDNTGAENSSPGGIFYNPTEPWMNQSQ
jgi:hypothetical protein